MNPFEMFPKTEAKPERGEWLGMTFIDRRPLALSDRMKLHDNAAYRAAGEHAHSVLYHHVTDLVEAAERNGHDALTVLIDGLSRMNRALSNANKSLLECAMKAAHPPMILMTQGGPLTAGTTLTPPKVVGKPLATVSAPKLPRDRGQDGRP